MRANAITGLVRRLLTLEAAGSQDHAALIEAAERVTDKLRAHLSKRIGQEGFRTLLARALSLTIPQFPHLRFVQVGTDGSLAGLHGAAESGSPGIQENGVEGAVALVAQFLTLLVTFIGEDLTLRILSTVWSEASLEDAIGRESERP